LAKIWQEFGKIIFCNMIYLKVSGTNVFELIGITKQTEYMGLKVSHVYVETHCEITLYS